MRKLIAGILCSVMFFVTSCASGYEGYEEVKSSNTVNPASVTATLYEGETVLATGSSPKEISLVNGEINLLPKMKLNITLTGSKYVFLKIGTAFEEALLYLPDGIFEYIVPDANAAKVYPDGAWTGTLDVSARIPTQDELKAERNLAYNPYDTRTQTEYYPHASANSECRGEAAFLARNAIDGFSSNTGHGDYPYQSWGPEQIDSPELYIDFGREVVVTQVILSIRADFPHDTYWSKGNIAYTDGTVTPITLQKTAKEQIFDLSEKKTSSISLTELTGEKGWAGITEIKIIGREII